MRTLTFIIGLALLAVCIFVPGVDPSFIIVAAGLCAVPLSASNPRTPRLPRPSGSRGYWSLPDSMREPPHPIDAYAETLRWWEGEYAADEIDTDVYVAGVENIAHLQGCENASYPERDAHRWRQRAEADASFARLMYKLKDAEREQRRLELKAHYAGPRPASSIDFLPGDQYPPVPSKPSPAIRQRY